MIRLRVRSGMERDAAELLSTAETVPGVSPRCSATAFRVTWFSRLRGARLPFIFGALPGGREGSERSSGAIVTQLAAGIEPPRGRRAFKNIVIFPLTEGCAVSLNLDRRVRLFDA